MDRMIALKLIILVVALQSRETLSSSNVYRLDPVVVVEEPPIGTLVLDLTSTLGLSESQIGEFKFRFYSPQSLTAHYFLIDPLTGQVKTQRTLDREYLCETKVCGPCSTNNCTLPVEIVVASQSKSASIAQKGTAKHHHAHSQQKFVSFDVVIEDKNEFAPKFPRDTLYLNISETAPANFSIPLDAAVDRDSSSSRITYSIEPEMPNKLALSLYPQLSLVVLQPLDYEVEKELRFKIIATDGTDSGSSNKRLSSSCSIVLRVLDINDNLPQFDRDEYEYRLDEDRAVGGTKLIRVHASDRDDGENGLVKYTLVEQTATSSLQKDQQQRHLEAKNIFQIDELSGWISVSPDSTLDYEQASIYRLVVRAQDSGLVNSMPVYTNVLIYLNDINDNRPQINLTLPGFDPSSDEQDTQSQGPIASSNSNLSSIELSEYTAPNSFVAQISVSDADSGANGQVELDMKQFKRESFSKSSSSHHKWVESSDFELVHLFKNIYSLMTKSQLDRERFDQYRVELRASDAGIQPKPLETVLDVRIYVKDENDNRPTFVNPTNAMGYEFSLVELDSNETKSEPITIGYIQAADYDTEEHSKLTYSIDSPDFRINSETGELTASNSAILDRELTDAYEFNVTASDGLNKESIRVRVQLIDRNDNKPLFDMPLYRFHVVENHVSTSVGVLQAIDVDKPNTGFSRVMYALIDDSSNEDELDDELDNDDDEDDGSLRYSDYFRVNETTGELMQLKPFDYEMVKTVRFKAIAYDNFNKTPTNNSTCIVEITIENENDNRPQLVFPKDSDQPLVFSLDTPSQSANNSSSIAPSTTSSSRQLITRLIATDLDLPNRLTYNLQRQIRIRKQAPDHQHLDLVSLFDVEPETGSVYLRGGSKRASDNIGGFYALIVELNDRQSELNKVEVVQKNVVYVFLVLTNNGGNLLTNEISRLRDILNTTRLNDDSDNSDSGDDYSDYSEDESQIRSQDYRFERVLNQLKHDTNLVRLTKKKSNYLGGIGSKSSIIDGTNLAKLKQHLLNSLNTSNYLPLLILVIFSCVALSVLFASLCMLSSYYKRRRTSRNRPEKLSAVLSSSSSSPKRNSGGQIYSDSSYYDKALTTGDEKEEETLSSKVGTSSTATSSQHSNHSSPNSHGHHHHLNQKHTVESGVSSSSASPMSLVSAELIADGAPTDFTDACINMTPSRRLLVKKRGAATTTTTFMSTIDRKNRGKNVPTGTKSQVNEEERAVLIVNTNCSSTSSTTTTTAAASSSSSSASSSSHNNNNTHHPHHHHRAHVTSLSQHGTPVRKPSISISNNTAGGGNPLLVLVASSPSHHQANSTTNKPPQVASSESLSSVELNNTNTNTNLKTFKTSTYKQVTEDNSSDNNAGFATMSRTMPRNVHHSHYQQQQQQRHNNLDQRPLNLPVNELFKRYELKRQAMANGANGSVSSSSGGCGSLTSLNSATANGNNSQQNGNNNQQINVSTFASPRLASKIPDYFFKDEKEQRKLMAATSRGGKQLISLKVVESSLNSSTTNPPTTSN